MRHEHGTSSVVSIAETGLILWCKGKVGIPLEMKQGKWASSRDEMENTGPFSSCGEIHEVLPEL